MRRNMPLVASLCLYGLLAPGLIVQLSADEKKDSSAAAKDVKFSCSVHGPANMTLTLSLEKGNAGEKPRDIQIVGRGGAKWIVTIDGTPAPSGGGGDNKDTIKVRPKDTITWSVAANAHGVAFAEQNLAEAMLSFDKKAGKTLEDLTKELTTQDWKDFGTKLWGVKGTRDVGILAKATVKE